MSFLDFSIRIKLLVEEINATREEESILIGDELRKQVRTRVQKQKVNADGSPFGQYSQALLPQWFFYDKSKTDTAEDKIRSGDWFISYADFREANDLYSGDIDFTFTGDMWRNTGVTEVQNNGDSVVVFIGGQTTRAANILEWQEPRYGNILEANEEEEKFVEEAHRERIFNKIARYL
jgi:hypothetical protein